jgi:hypothetical protein
MLWNKTLGRTTKHNKFLKGPQTMGGNLNLF